VTDGEDIMNGMPQITLEYLAEERWIPAHSMLWSEIAELQRQGLVTIRWEERGHSWWAWVAAKRRAS
jgi:DNA-binding PadR family transcriptional regulator